MEKRKERVFRLWDVPSLSTFATMVRLLTTIKRLFSDSVTTIDYRLSTFVRLSDYPATIDFATISDFGDFRTDGGDPDRGWAD